MTKLLMLATVANTKILSLMYAAAGMYSVVGAATFMEMANNFASVVASIFQYVGTILCFWGGFNFAMSLEARDNTQRISGVLTFFAGFLLLSLPALISYISGGMVTVSAADFG